MGIWLVLFAYGMFAIVDISAKWLILAGIPALQVVMARYAGHFAACVVDIPHARAPLELLRCNRKLFLSLRAVFLILATVFNFLSLKFIPLSLASTIFFSAPIMVCALSYPLLGERVGYWRWSAITVGFIGVVIVIQPFDAEFHPAVFLSLMAALGFALYSIMTRQLSGEISIAAMQFSVGAIGVLALGYFGIAAWQSPDTQLGWLLIIGIGVIAWFGHNMLVVAHIFLPPHIIMPFAYSFILYVGIGDYFIFNNIPSLHTIIGAVIITISGLFILYRQYKLSQSNNPPNYEVKIP